MPSPQAGAPITPPPPMQRSSSIADTSSASASKDAMEAPTPTPPLQTLRSSTSSGLDRSPDAVVDPESPPSTTGDAAASPSPSSRRGGSLSTASRSPNGPEKAATDSRKEEGVVPPAPSTTGGASAPPPPSPRRGGSPSTASRSPSPVSSPTAADPVPNDHEKAAPDTHKEDEIVPAVMDQTTNSDAAKMTLASDSKQQSQRNEDLDPMEGVVNQWEEELDRREQEVEQREEAALGRDKRQYDRWLQLAEWETDLRLTHYAVQQGHARLSKWLKEADAEWTDRVTRVRRMEDEVRFERLRLKDKEDEKEDKKEEERMLKEKQGREEKEDEENELTHCFGTGFFPWEVWPPCLWRSQGRGIFLAAQQSKSTPTPSDAPNPIIADATAMTMRISKPKAKVYQFETRLCAARFQRPTTYRVGACPGLDRSNFGSKDPQMVNIYLRVLTRPDENFNERDLGSITHETLKTVISQYNFSQLITESELVSWEIRKVLTERTSNFGISIDDVSIISLSFEKEFTHGTEETKQMITQEAKQHNRSAMIKSQEDDQIWNKRQIGYIFDLGTALGLIFLIRPLLPTGYDRWVLVTFAAVWGLGSFGLPFGLFGTSRFEKNCSRHVGRFISLSCSLLVIYGIYIHTLRVTGVPEPTLSFSSFGITDGHADADWSMTLSFSVIAALVFLGHLYSWIRGCCTVVDRDNLPL